MSAKDSHSINRRDFLKVSSAAVAGMVAGAEGILSAQEESAGGMKYRLLGKTKLKVSEIGFGGVQVTEAAVIEKAFDKGITLFHTSPDYGNGQSIAAFGEALKNLKSKHDKIVLAIKQGKQLSVDQTLMALNTDYADIYIPPKDANQLANPELRGQFGKLKKSGKARYCGFTNHKGVVDSMEVALKTEFVDVILATYSMGNKKEMDPVLSKLKAKGVGFLAMKTKQGLEKGQDPVPVIRGLMENKDVDSVLISIGSVQAVDSAVELSTKKMTMRERREFYRRMLAMAGVCGSCGRCEGMCPKRIPVPDIFRFHMYATLYEPAQQAVGFEEYRALPATAVATNCDDCGACERVCPNSVAIRRRLKEAHELLA
jgi:predicted aldo/keto reductase-like oxidoreductase